MSSWRSYKSTFDENSGNGKKKDIAFFLTMEIVFIPVEEDAMEEAFGQEYPDYKKRVRRWI